jgi:hypothetical protein
MARTNSFGELGELCWTIDRVRGDLFTDTVTFLLVDLQQRLPSLVAPVAGPGTCHQSKALIGIFPVETYMHAPGA